MRLKNDKNGSGDYRSCIIVVGSTGTGKSSTIEKVTGNKVKSGSGHKSITRICEIFSMPGRDDLVWVDTTGWDDLEGQDDIEIFQSILQLLNRHSLTSVKAILWTIHPGSIRQDTTLDNQAKLINQFADREIWDNVVIICKQAMNPEHEANGALKAAYRFNPTSKVQVIGYRFLDDPTLRSEQRLLYESKEDIRKIANILDDQEIRQLIMDKISTIPKDVQIIFNSYRCLKCGVEGDKRLLPQFCHMQPMKKHPGSLYKRHPKSTEPYHPSQNIIHQHTGKLKDSTCSGCCCIQKKRKFDCCRGDDNSKGCKEMWACCSRLTDDPGCQLRYQCCKQDKATATEGCETLFSCCQKPLISRTGGGNDLIEPEGCQTVCQKCGAEWGTDAKDCFKTNHELTEIVKKKY